MSFSFQVALWLLSLRVSRIERCSRRVTPRVYTCSVGHPNGQGEKGLPGE